MNLQTSMQYMKGVGEKRALTLRRLGVATIGDLLAHVPRAYEDWQTVVPLAQAPLGEVICVSGVVSFAPAEHRLRPGMTLYRTQISDDTGTLDITIFNSSYQAEKLREGTAYLFYGKIGKNAYTHQREMSSPQFAAPDQARLHPVYPLTEGISSRQLETLVERAFALVRLQEFLPNAILEQYALLPREEALRAIHRPKDWAQAQAARRRLAFNELLTLQLGLRLLRQGHEGQRATPLQNSAAQDFLQSLPFAPTTAQARAVREAAVDMAKERPMQRLLQGDVGSGKTAVAAALLAQAAAGGAQAALLAPTELLARQHHQTLQKLGSLQPALLLGSTPAAQKKKTKAGLAEGTVPLVVGTHALLQGDVVFANLALVIVDEQHRFGVEQRKQLTTQNAHKTPHTLVMSATPIPRSLALMIYGELDISVLDELPPGRVPIKTYQVPCALRPRAYAYVRKHLDQGLRGYIVCPRVEEDEQSAQAAAKEFYAQLAQGAFKGYALGLLHGKMKPRQKEEVMNDFAAGKLQLLVATTVVEVGVDVPDAVIMIVENAERFGLSQLHQLRGRVGRGGGKSTCILISDAENPEAQHRFAVLKETNDGFAIARRDLELRGPGEFFGARQHGLPPLRIADIATDTQLLAESKAAAEAIGAKDPTLQSPAHEGLKRACEKLFSTSYSGSF
ncbi:MAG: ATP-dependent DNA helicase RecG [Oscillospiraceae bacterium]|jgi:ATP-dependent DNA helicase RecG|nr:ATP-dependent DNA helicase RecG [Oscillospiraceae bacterium]